MIKADIVKKISEDLNAGGQTLKDKDALEVVDKIIESVKDVVVRDGRLEIRDFGVFQVKQCKERIGRNPKNKKQYPIPAHKVVTFKPGKEIKTIDLEGRTPENGGDEDVD